jgi:hypothetical protein
MKNSRTLSRRFALHSAKETTMPTPERHDARPTSLRDEPSPTACPDRVILVYDADSGVRAMLLDVVKKALGREDCALCEITYGPLGKRGAWRACEARLGAIVDELHRDEIPDEWGIARSELPCVLGRAATARPFVLLSREEIALCSGSSLELERRVLAALARHEGSDR